MIGTLPVLHYVLDWATVGEVADPLRVLVTFALDGHPCGYGLGRLDGEVFTPWCGCEHSSPSGAEDCPRGRAARADFDATAARARTAALPAPAGAFYLRHCGKFWHAHSGGACATCGAAGEVFTPRVQVANVRAKGWTTVTTTDVTVLSALIDAGLEPGDVRVSHGADAIVSGLRAVELGAALTAAGWACEVRGVPRAAKAGAA